MPLAHEVTIRVTNFNIASMATMAHRGDKELDDFNIECSGIVFESRIHCGDYLMLGKSVATSIRGGYRDGLHSRVYKSACAKPNTWLFPGE